MIITVMVIFVGVNMVFVVFTGASITDHILDAMGKFVGYIFSGRAYNICEDFNNKELSLEEFQSLLQALDREECGLAQARIRFTVTGNDLKKIADVIGTDKTLVILEGNAKPLGANSILVYGNPGPRPLKRDDKLELRRAGTPRPDIVITILEQGCDPTDEDCDASCTFKRGVCDPLCYQHEKATGEMCDIDCVDANKNEAIDKNDMDGICDLDCYNNDADPNNAYDPDCVKARQQKDDVCDPDSNGVEDSICDIDCAGDNHICDPDCDGQAGRPYDRECYECDKTCNNFCSRVCQEEEDPDCMQGFGSKTPCCGNRRCEQEAGEQCSSCSDCPSATTCKGFYTGNMPAGKDAICCPDGSASDDFGCGIYEVNIGKGKECACDQQCSENLECGQALEGSGLSGSYCCEDGKQWDGNECVTPKVYKIVFSPIGYSSGDADLFRSHAQKSFDFFLSVSPFRECTDTKNRIKMLVVDPADCQAGCYDVCSDCPGVGLGCAQSKYPNEWDKVIVLCKGN